MEYGITWYGKCRELWNMILHGMANVIMELWNMVLHGMANVAMEL